MSKIIFFFGNLIPTLLFLGLFCLIGNLHSHPLVFIYVFLYIYIFPVLLYRCLYVFFPKKEGRFIVYEKDFLVWWYGMQLQICFARLSFLEEFLRIFPFLYSTWLRLWGSKIGKAVFWSPGVIIADRGDIEVGDYTLIGYGAKLTSHLMSKSRKRELLIYSKIIIGKNVIIGAESNLSSGVKVSDGVTISALSTLLPYSEWKVSKEYTAE